MLLGYARVSTTDQNPDHQVDALRRAGVAAKDIYIDHASGAKASRLELDNVLGLLRDGDVLKVTRLGRLGRSVLHLITLGAELRERGVGLHVIEQGIDTTTAEDRAMFGMLSVLAELQRELIVANTRDGLAAARVRGRKGGRRPRLNTEQIAHAQELRHRRSHRPADRRSLRRPADHHLGPPRRREQGQAPHAPADVRDRPRRRRGPRMTLGSFIHGALADLSPADLERMLELDETRFVEHKGDLGEQTNYQLAKSVAAFANTLGGWLLLGIKNGKPHGSTASWTSPGDGPTLVDMVRDRLRCQIDPLPAFEARLITHTDGPVGVVRVYESADTPHIALQTGSVFVREVAGDADVANPGRPGASARGDRIYKATQIRSRAQLLELAARGAVASQRVRALVDPTRPLPLTDTQLLLRFEHSDDGLRAVATDRGLIVVRAAPYSLPARFRSWATTADGAAAALSAIEDLAHIHGLATDWTTPHPSGVSVAIQVQPPLLTDGAGFAFDAEARVTLDGAGVAGAAELLTGPDDTMRRPRVQTDDLGTTIIRPAIDAALAMLAAGEFPAAAGARSIWSACPPRCSWVRKVTRAHNLGADRSRYSRCPQTTTRSTPLRGRRPTRTPEALDCRSGIGPLVSGLQPSTNRIGRRCDAHRHVPPTTFTLPVARGPWPACLMARTVVKVVAGGASPTRRPCRIP